MQVWPPPVVSSLTPYFYVIVTLMWVSPMTPSIALLWHILQLMLTPCSWQKQLSNTWQLHVHVATSVSTVQLWSEEGHLGDGIDSGYYCCWHTLRWRNSIYHVLQQQENGIWVWDVKHPVTSKAAVYGHIEIFHMENSTLHNETEFSQSIKWWSKSHNDGGEYGGKNMSLHQLFSIKSMT